ncbi:hypothetical protein SODALDRAFT_327500 [Sodiomyces alkalinus F11]|uniref:Uncharacterized protein n=1 Tax=Sodiomyces alkalinus (strain CBS 110278 / VKM F-3762 / F11) TaxID=1314773 RepID=A0A3N2Q958_SODAK|nr:hypothetical protein SODALDRAFT_327500 [Sodiomyces alkalinus F11]ROT43309.1 hypothetical protein SODALDRAFT_327500 [Sodiomyces alkalinus F11]
MPVWFTINYPTYTYCLIFLQFQLPSSHCHPSTYTHLPTQVINHFHLNHLYSESPVSGHTPLPFPCLALSL